MVENPPRKVTVSLKDKIKEELDRMEQTGVIDRQTKPTYWVNSMVAVVKPNKNRICIEPRNLNEAIRREHYPMTTIEEVFAGMPQAKVFFSFRCHIWLLAGQTGWQQLKAMYFQYTVWKIPLLKITIWH